MQVITEDLISHLMYNTLTVRIYGMIESKKSKKGTPSKEDDAEEAFVEQTLKRAKTLKKQPF